MKVFLDGCALVLLPLVVAVNGCLWYPFIRAIPIFQCLIAVATIFPAAVLCGRVRQRKWTTWMVVMLYSGALAGIIFVYWLSTYYYREKGDPGGNNISLVLFAATCFLPAIIVTFLRTTSR